MIEQFIKAIYGEYKGIALVLMLNKQVANDNGRTRPFNYPEELPKMVQFIRDMDDAGVDVYTYMSLFKRLETKSRWEVQPQKEYSIGCPLMWIDADTCHHSYLFIPPSITLETSPGSYQAFWPLDRLLDPQEAEDIAKRLAYYHVPKGADKGGWQCNKAMRIPGTHNHKPERVLMDGSRPLVKMLKCEPTPLSPSIFDVLPTIDELKLERGTLLVPGAPKADYVGSATKYDFTEPYPEMPDLPGDAHYPPDLVQLWNLRQFDDRSGWANAMVKGLFQCGLPDEQIIAAMVGHPIYVDKAFEKWGGQPLAIREDVLRILERLRENGVAPRLVLGKKIEQKPTARRAELDAIAKGTVPIYESNRKRVMTPLEVTRMEPLPWLIDGYIPQKAQINVFGPSGVGKSFQILDWSFRIAEGREWNGAKVHQGSVVYVVAEGLEMMGSRVEAWCDYNKIMIPDRHNLFFYSEPVQLADSASVDRFMYDISSYTEKPVLVIFDTLSQCLIGGDENSPQDMTKVNGYMLYLREVLDCATIIVHHTGYDGDHERGHSSFPASAATRIKIDERMGQLVVDCEKQRGGKEFETVYVDRIEHTVQKTNAPSVSSLVLQEGVEPAKRLAPDMLGNKHIKILTVLASVDAIGSTELMARAGLQERPFMRYKSELEQSGYLTTEDRKVHILPDGMNVIDGRSLAKKVQVVESTEIPF